MRQLLLPSFFLSLFGVFNLFGLRGDLFLRQIFYVIFGFLIFALVKKIGGHFFRINAKFFYWFFVFILIVTYIVGIEVKGSRRWLDFYLIKFQASEFFKVFFILFLSQYLSQKYLRYGVTVFLKSVLYFLIPTLIIFKQPDLGNAIVYFFIFLMMILFSPLPKKYIVYFLSLILIFLPFGWFFLAPYQRSRIISFLNPHLDTQGTAYNMIQAVITIGSGKFFGRGLGLGTQSRLYFLPESETDFAFASLVEQFGFLGGALVVVFYAAIIYLIVSRAIKFYLEKDEEGKKKFLFAVGMLSYVIFQVFVNVGMNLGLLPIAGVALPFISYGGSSLLSLMIGFALVP